MNLDHQTYASWKWAKKARAKSVRYSSSVFPRVCSRPTSGTQLCSSCMITAHQNQWVQSWESIETTFGYLQTPGFSRSISRDKLTPGYHMLMPPCPATFHLAIPCLWLSLRHSVHLLRVFSYLFFTLLHSRNFLFGLKSVKKLASFNSQIFRCMK